MRIIAVSTTVFTALACSLVGCGMSHPVTEVSVLQSGVTVDPSATLETSLGDWPQWRGPTGDGVSDGQTPVTEWDDQLNIRWRTEIPGRGHSSPIVVGPSVYLATAVEKDEQQMVMAFDRSTGVPRWKRVVHQGGFPPAKQIHNKATNANGTIACDGERLYINFFNDGKIHVSALDLTGEIVWQTVLGDYLSRFGYAPSPVLYKSLVIVAVDNAGGGYLAALDRTTGEIAWRVARGTMDNYSSPLVANVGGRDQLLISGCAAVTSYDPATGNQNWRTEYLPEATCGTVVATSDHVFASGGYPKKETVCLTADGVRVWSNQVDVYEPSMVIAGDRLVAVTDAGIAYCWSTENGDQLWRKRLSGNFSSSPILCGESIYVSNLKGDTYVFRAGDRYDEIARNRLGDDCYASPAVSENEIFMRIGVGRGDQRQEELVCIGNSD